MKISQKGDEVQNEKCLGKNPFKVMSTVMILKTVSLLTNLNYFVFKVFSKPILVDYSQKHSSFEGTGCFWVLLLLYAKIVWLSQSKKYYNSMMNFRRSYS